jgi:DNA-binding MarR family transcriptional regulator/N-acetylglutamate synthase-like GNAT family acetyltransferase
MHTAIDQPIEAVRHFNRFYTRQIGLLTEGLVNSPFSLTEARVLYELAHREQPTATELGNDLGLDLGYLSRILRGFQTAGLIAKSAAPTDARQSLITLTDQGRAAFAKLEESTRHQIQGLLSTLTAADQNRLVNAMRTIEAVLAPQPERQRPYLLRPPEPGDMGWVVARHGALYAQEYGWDAQFEALVAEIVAHFLRNYDPARERCWIAERDGENIGSVFLVKQSETVAKLRLLLVEPKARGLGVGSRLVEECVRCARQCGYERITLWTNSVLTAARRIYERAGFQLVVAEAHHSFGHDLVGETWELPLR